VNANNYRGHLNESPMDLSAVIAGMSDILREMIGANITLQLNLEREGPWVKADAGRGACFEVYLPEIPAPVLHFVLNASGEHHEKSR
jgi:hypothetical protein